MHNTKKRPTRAKPGRALFCAMDRLSIASQSSALRRGRNKTQILFFPGTCASGKTHLRPRVRAAQQVRAAVCIPFKEMLAFLRESYNFSFPIRRHPASSSAQDTQMARSPRRPEHTPPAPAPRAKIRMMPK